MDISEIMYLKPLSLVILQLISTAIQGQPTAWDVILLILFTLLFMMLLHLIIALKTVIHYAKHAVV